MNYGRYNILKEVGKGSMGVVYQAKDPHIERIVAIKVLRKDRLFDDSIIKMFIKEAKVIGKLSHPNIVSIYDIGEQDGEVYIAMEFLEGESLADQIKQKRYDVKDLLAIGTQIAETLDYAHLKGVVHRDIKPSNIIVQSDGQVKITDFGIAHVDDVSGTLQTQAGEIKGTPAYMSPEQVRGGTVDGRSDLFSLGIILYEMSAGRRPFGGEGKNMITVLDEIARVVPEEPYKVNSGVIDRPLSSLVMKALQKEPSKRYQTGRDLADALKSCRQDGTVAKKKPLPVAMISGAALAIIIVAGGAVFFLKGSGDKLQPPAPVAQSAPAPATTSPVTVPASPVTPPVPAAPSSPSPPAKAVMPEPKKNENQKNTTAKQKKEPEKKSVKSAAPVESSAPVKGSGGGESPSPAVDAGTTQYAFLKVATTPAGAQVYVNGSLKGMTPVKLRLNLGKYKVRLARSGFKSVETSVNLNKMAEFPVSEELQPE